MKNATSGKENTFATSLPLSRFKVANQNDSFYDRVYAVVRQIPRGRVSTYGAIARYLSIGRASRLVGNAMNHSSAAFPYVPAQRVVNRVGLLSGKHHFGGQVMRDLLENEGIIIENDKVKNFSSVFWDPSLEIEPIRP